MPRFPIWKGFQVLLRCQRFSIDKSLYSTNNIKKYRRVHKEALMGLNYSLVGVNNTVPEAIVRHPCLAYDDYDVNGQPKIWKVMKIMESVRLFAHHYPLGDKGETFRDYDELTKDCLIFLITSELVFNKEIYNLPDQNPWLRTKITGGYIGKSSLNSLTEIFTEDNDQILATNINQIVCIDKRDRRPMELAPWWREKYSESGKKHKPLTLEKYEKPPETCSYDTYVAWSDTDLNLHTNWTAYARFAVDAAHHCTKEGSLRNVADNISRGIYKVQFYFYGESVQGDRITVHLWEDSADPQVLMADMYNRGTSICQVRMTFH